MKALLIFFLILAIASCNDAPRDDIEAEEVPQHQIDSVKEANGID